MDTRTLTMRTWTSILRAVQHPTYTAPLLKSTLLARMRQLQNCANAYPMRNVAPATLGTSVTINGAPHDITSTQRDLATKLAKELQIDSTEASKAVLQQARLGIVDVEGVEKAYMAERTDLLRVVKILLSLDVNGSENTDMVDMAREIVKQIKGKNDFVTKLVEGLHKRIEESLPAKALANIHSSLVWSRQVRMQAIWGKTKSRSSLKNMKSLRFLSMRPRTGIHLLKLSRRGSRCWRRRTFSHTNEMYPHVSVPLLIAGSLGYTVIIGYDADCSSAGSRIIRAICLPARN